MRYLIVEIFIIRRSSCRKLIYINWLFSFSENCWELKKCSAAEVDNETQVTSYSIFENDNQTSPSVMSLTINDPRVLTAKGDMVDPREKSASIMGRPEDDIDRQKTPATIAECSVGLLSSRCLGNDETSFMCDSISLWDVSKGISPPVEESVLCMEKHHKRLTSYCLNDKGSKEQHASAKGQSSRFCPILVINNNNLKNSDMR